MYVYVCMYDSNMSVVQTMQSYMVCTTLILESYICFAMVFLTIMSFLTKSFSYHISIIYVLYYINDIKFSAEWYKYRVLYFFHTGITLMYNVHMSIILDYWY